MDTKIVGNKKYHDMQLFLPRKSSKNEFWKRDTFYVRCFAPENTVKQHIIGNHGKFVICKNC